ncbi:TonB-dependent siderophore receptor [Methylosinus sp. Sm6]|uniref:TonB-dependent siderophore receptor n=1 Tax=Methylosinus sp. Sm6 TaxID=2866948 RepID=UPI001C9949A0|nr:TonB-dependent receptor [Methylosinus sp. Sm6]MBY6240622.1 TonB-dependent receptor [Methylosinus sp. Sm6]
MRFCDFLLTSVGASALAVFCTSGAALAEMALPPIDIDATRARAAVAADGGPATVETSAGPVRGYQAKTSTATRLATPIRELPMSIEVIPRKLIDDQLAVSQSEAFRNVSGLHATDPLFPGGLGPSLRGMRAERYVDGLPNYYDFGARDLLASVERIEVLKGPASILFQGGPSPVGGVVNVVSRMPTEERFAEAGVRAGGYRFVSPYIDVNQPLTADKSVLFRVTAQYESTHSNIDVLHRRSYSIDPTLKFAPTQDTSLTLQGHVSRRDQADYPGLPATGTIDRSFYSVRPTSFLSNAQTPDATSESAGITARLDHRFDETFASFTSFRWTRSRMDEPSQIPFSANTPTYVASPLFGNYGSPSSFVMLNSILSQQLEEIAVTSNFTAKFDLGPTQHRLLVGGDFNRVWERGLFAAAYATGRDPSLYGALLGFPQPTDFRSPAFPGYVYPQRGQYGYTLFNAGNNQYQNSGATVQLQSTLFERLHVLGALRVAMVDIDSHEAAYSPPRTFHTSEAKVLPRIGASYDLLDWLSAFGNYSQGLRAVTFFSGPNGAAPHPEGSEQFEAGVKLDGLHGLSGTLAYFDLKRTNVPTTAPGSLTQSQSGEWHSSGFEADLVWQPTAELSFLASYAHIDAKISRNADPRLQGAALNLAPPDSGRLWGNYAFGGQLRGWSLGAGLYASSGQVVEIAQPWRTSGYVVFDAALAYRHENFTFAVNAKNLGDRRYLVQYPYLSGNVAPAEGRTFFVTVSARM